MFKSIQIYLAIFRILSFLLTANARSMTYSQIADVKIKVQNDKWQCDRIECPLKTYRCFVAKEKNPQEPTHLQRINICYSKDNQVLNRSTIVETVDPDSKVNLHINSYRSGVLNSINWFSSNGKRIANGKRITNNDDPKKWNVDLTQMTNRNPKLNSEMARINNDLFEMHTNLTKINQNFWNFNENQAEMNGDLTGMNGNLTQMNGNLSGMNGNLTQMNGNLSGMNGNLTQMNGNLSGMNGNLTQMNGNLSGMNANLTGMNANLSQMNANLSEMNKIISEIN